MGVIFLHGINIILEMTMVVWIASKIFSYREYCDKRHILSEAIANMIVLFSVESQLLKNFPKSIKMFFCVGLIIVLIYYRCHIENRKQIPQKYLKIINRGIILLEFGAATGILIWNGWLFYISSIMVLLGNLMMPFLIYRYFKCSFFQAYVLELLYNATIQLLKHVYMVSVAVLEDMKLADAVVSGRFHHFSAISYVTIVLLILFWFIKNFSICKLLKEFISKHVIILFLAGITEFQILSSLMDLGEDGFDLHDFELVLIFMLIVVLILFGFLIRVYVSLIEGEKKLLDVRNDAIEQQYEELQVAYQQNRCLIHDEKHMVQYLLECLENSEVQEAIDFARKYQENITSQSKHSWTGISTLDFIINMKKRRMDNSGIEFAVNAELENLPMNDTDFVVLLGNLFDNAIEAAEKCEKGKREIHLFIKNVNEMFLLQMINTSTTMPQQKMGQFITSKVEKEKHGLGIESVRRIVEKYNGNIDFQYDKTTFRVKLICSMS